MRDIDGIQVAILKSYGYMHMAFDNCLTDARSAKLLGTTSVIARSAVTRSVAH